MRSLFERGRDVGQAEPGTELVCIATVLEVRSWWYLLPFLRMSARVFSQLNDSPGLIRWRVKSNILRRRFYTFTVWKDRTSVTSFVQAHPHAQAVRLMRRWSGPSSAFVEWISTHSTFDWSDALNRLKEPTYTYKPPRS